MRCRKVRKLVSRDLDGELDDARRTVLERHLRKCGECRYFAAQLAALAGCFELPPIPEPGPDFVPRTLAALPDEAPTAYRLAAWREFFRPAPAALAAASLALGVFLALKMNGASAQAEETDETVALVAEVFDAAPADSVSGRYLELVEDTEQ